MDKNFSAHSDGRVRRAYEIAAAAHRGQVDKSGVAYINHPLTVATNVCRDCRATP